MTRILAVSHTPVWPVRSGSAVRRLMALEALGRIGSVDLLYVGEVEYLTSAVPNDAPVSNVIEMPVPRHRPTAIERLLWSVRPARPLQMLEWQRDARKEPPVEHYDVLWCFRPVAFDLARQVRASTVVVDFDDLEDQKLRLAHRARTRRGPMGRRFAERRNIQAWRRYQARIAREVDAVVVCSEEDAEALGNANVHVVPNGSPSVSPRSVSPGGATLILVGLFDYEPNADAAEFFVHSILPRIRQAVPEASLRLVGPSSRRVERLAGPGVTIVGEVPDLAVEYERADISVAPIRFGGGTRIKILEAFSRRIPVVSTTMGAAGLGARHGRELLLADDAEAFADACVALLTDEHLAQDLQAAAFTLYTASFSQAAVDRAVERVVDDARAGWRPGAAGQPPSGGSPPAPG